MALAFFFEMPARAVEDRPPSSLRALAVVALVGALALLWVASPLGTGLYLGLMVAFTLRPFYRALTRTFVRPALAAVLGCALASLLTFLGVGTVVDLLVNRSAAIVDALQHAMAPGGRVADLGERVARWLAPLGFHAPEVYARFHQALAALAVESAKGAAVAAGATLDLLLATLITLLTTYFVLRHWTRLVRWMEIVLPLRPCVTRELLGQLESTGRAVMVGTVFVGLLQGLLAGVGYSLAGLPQPAFLGAITAIASVLPGLGTMFVWVPAGLVLAIGGRLPAALGELAWGSLVVVGLCDGYLRAKLIGKRDEMGLFPTLIGLFGGLKLFGFIGFLLGPTLVSFGLSVLKIYGREKRGRSVPSGP